MNVSRILARTPAMRLVSGVLLFALLVQAAPGVAAPPVQATHTLQDCSAVAEETLQSELNLVTQEVFANALARVDLEHIVASQWVTQQMDPAVDTAVDLAVERVQSETDLWNKFVSGWSPDKAKELTLAVANYSFDAPAFRTKMNGLSVAVAEDVADQLALASADSVSAALYCLQTFIGHNYSKALVNAFEQRVQAATTTSNLINSDEVSPDILKMVDQHQMALGGIGVIIAAQITRKIVTSIAERISERVAGRILGRVLGKAGSTIIPVAGWIIGAGMIAYDVYTSRDGALPQIQESIKSEPVKAGVRSEIARSIRPELEAELPSVARSIANDLYAEWRNTKRNIRAVMDLSAQNPRFAAVLASLQTPEQVAQLVDLVALLTKNGDQAALNQAIADGTLERVVKMPAAATTIAKEDGSLQAAIDWYDAVGGRIDQVVVLELYKQRTPQEIDLGQLDALLALNDKTAITRLAMLPAAQSAALLQLPSEVARALANQLTPDELGWLGTQLATLSVEQRNALAARLLSQPRAIAPLRQLGNLDEVMRSGDLDSAITFVTGARDTGSFWGDVTTVVAGGVSPALFTAKHGLWPSLGAVGIAVLLTLVALRMIYGMGSWLVEPLSIFRRRK